MSACAELRDRLPAFVDGALDGAAARRAAEHVAACPACSAEAAALRAVLERVAGLPVPELPPAFWQGFEGSVRRRVAASPAPGSSLWERVTGWLAGLPGARPIPALVAASVLGLLLAIGLVRSDRPTRPGPAPEVLITSQDLGIGQDLDLLEQLDLLEDVEVLERLDLLRSLDVVRPKLG